MRCEDAQPLLHGYIDGELDLVRSLEIEQHVKDCPACAQAYENHLALRSAITGSSLYFEAPPGLQKRVRAAVRRESRTETKEPAFSWRWLVIGGSLAAAAVAIVLLLNLAPGLSRPATDALVTQEVIASHVRSLMVNHLTDVASSDQHTVKPWFAGKLDFSPQVKDFADQGFPLVGGRLDYVGNRSVAALVYQHGKHAINVFIWPSPGTPDAAETMTTQNGYNVIHWSKSGMTYWVVSDLNDRELRIFTSLVQGQGS
jgi:anti-sigma factor RsiW